MVTSRGRTILTLAVGFALAGTAVTYAAIPDSGTKAFTGCYDKTSGALRVLDEQAGAACAATENQIQWQQQGVRYRGAYTATTAYAVNDLATYAGQTYIEKLANTAVPVTNTSNWALFSAGAAGPAGPVGPKGVPRTRAWSRSGRLDTHRP